MTQDLQKIVILCFASALVLLGGFFVYNNYTNQEEEQGNEATKTQLQVTEPKNASSVILQQKNTQSTSLSVTPHTTIFEFSGNGFGYPYRGNFSDVQNEIQLQNNKLRYLKLIINPYSIETGFSIINSQLQGEEFLDTRNFPNIVLQTTNIEYGKNTHATVAANLTIRGITKTLQFPATITDSSLTADFAIYALDFGISHPQVENTVQLHIFIEWNKPE